MRLRFCFVVTAMLLMLAGSPARAQTPTLKVGVPSLSMFTIMFHIAQDKGFFAKEGVNVEINHFESGSILMKALLSRAVDIADVETALVLSAVANNDSDLRVFGSQSQRLHFALYAKNDIKTLQDLYGRVFAISGIGALPHVVILALMDKAKLDANKITLVSVGGTGARLSALVAGKVDSTVGEFSPKIEAEPGLHRLAVVSPELPLYMAQATTTWADTLAAKKDVIEKYQRAMVEATRWAYTHKDEMIEAAQKHIPVSRDELSKVYDFYVLAQVWAINGEADRARLAYMQDLGVKLKTQNKAVDVDKLLDLAIYKNITAKLGTRDYPKAK